jgi:hypothetical protein
LDRLRARHRWGDETNAVREKILESPPASNQNLDLRPGDGGKELAGADCVL